MGLSELVGGPCVSNGIILKGGGGGGRTTIRQVLLFFFLKFSSFKKSWYRLEKSQPFVNVKTVNHLTTNFL